MASEWMKRQPFVEPEERWRSRGGTNERFVSTLGIKKREENQWMARRRWWCEDVRRQRANADDEVEESQELGSALTTIIKSYPLFYFSSNFKNTSLQIIGFNWSNNQRARRQLQDQDTVTSRKWSSSRFDLATHSIHPSSSSGSVSLPFWVV